MPDVNHPAKFTPKILDLIGEILRDVMPLGGTILDPFCGVGGVHWLRSLGYDTFGVELEEEWARQSMEEGPTWCGDFFQFALWNMLPGWPDAKGFDAVVTSPTYGNRMADNHNAKERCKACHGSGQVTRARAAEVGQEWDNLQSDDLNTCAKCGGAGKRNYKRMTYTHQLGRPLSEGSSAGMRYGPKYELFHRRAWRRVRDVILAEFGCGLFIVNVKNHMKLGEEVDVAGWHRDFITGKLGFEMVEDYKVPVKGMGFGANRNERVPYEHVMVFLR